MAKVFIEQMNRLSKRDLLKFLGLFTFLLLAVFLFYISPVKEYITPEILEHLIAVSGFWAPLVYILIQATSIWLVLPASITVVLGGTIFGAYWGFIYGWIGLAFGASGAFFIGRTMGRDFAASLMGDSLKKYDDAIERNGFTAVLYMRLLNIPFTPLNYGLSLTKIHFQDYIFGTIFGIVPSLFVLSFFGSALKEVWISGDWGELMSSKGLIAITLYLFSFFIPLIIKRFKLAKSQADNREIPS